MLARKHAGGGSLARARTRGSADVTLNTARPNQAANEAVGASDACGRHNGVVNRTRLNPPAIAQLTSADFTYPEVGATRGELPPGYHHVREQRLLTGSDFELVTKRLMTWEMHERAGFGVASSSDAVVVGGVVVVRRRVGPMTFKAPCRVVYVVDEPTRRGFAYGTLPGHPESGEEAFIVEAKPDGSLVATITAFSRPATFLARAGGPLGRRVQAAATRDYLEAMSA